MKKKIWTNPFKNLVILYLVLFAIPAISFAQEKQPTLVLKVEEEPYILRCFSKFNDKVKSHSIAVGDPSSVNYLYDANSGSLLKVWKGEFVDAAPMWINRGGGFFKTNAVVKDLSDAPTFYQLNDKGQQWPDSLPENSGFKFKGYKLDKSGKPTFKYLLNNKTVEDQVRPLQSQEGISRSITISSDESMANLYFLLAEGSQIKKTKGVYTISGKDYSIKLDDIGKAKALVRDSNGKKELVIEVPATFQANIKYSIIF